VIDGRRGPEDCWTDPWSAKDGFSLGPARQLDLDILVGGQPKTANVLWRSGAQVTVDGVAAAQDARIVPAGEGVVVIGDGVQRHVALKSYDSIDVDHLDGDGVDQGADARQGAGDLVEPGASVHKGERVAVVEAMKMEHALLAPHRRTVGEIAREPGAQIAEGATILSIEAPQRTLRAATPARRAQKTCANRGNRAGTSTGRAPVLNAAMPLHLLKLCVGCDSVQDLEDWIKSG
jgi:hypothetical protein